MTVSWELIFNVFANLAKFERRLIQETTRPDISALDRWLEVASMVRSGTYGELAPASPDQRIVLQKPLKHLITYQ